MNSLAVAATATFSGSMEAAIAPLSSAVEKATGGGEETEAQTAAFGVLVWLRAVKGVASVAETHTSLVAALGSLSGSILREKGEAQDAMTIFEPPPPEPLHLEATTM